MKKKILNIILIVTGIFLSLISFFIIDTFFFLERGPNPGKGTALWICYIIGTFISLYGTFNFTKWPAWIKVLLSVILAPLVVTLFLFITVMLFLFFGGQV